MMLQKPRHKQIFFVFPRELADFHFASIVLVCLCSRSKILPSPITLYGLGLSVNLWQSKYLEQKKAPQKQQLVYDGESQSSISFSHIVPFLRSLSACLLEFTRFLHALIIRQIYNHWNDATRGGSSGNGDDYKEYNFLYFRDFVIMRTLQQHATLFPLPRTKTSIISFRARFHLFPSARWSDNVASSNFTIDIERK